MSRKHNNQSKLGHGTSLTQLNPTPDDRIQSMIELMQIKDQANKIGGFYNVNIFKAIQDKIMSSKGSTPNLKESTTPKANKKNAGGMTQRQGSFKSVFPISNYTSTLSPKSLKSGNKRDRTSI